MPLEETLKNVIRELTEILEENKDVSDERWYRELKKSRNEIARTLLEMEKK